MSVLVLRIASGSGFVEHEVEIEDGRTLLDALEALRASGSGAGTTLRYRHSCHHGSCGTCGVLVDGVERLMCLTPLAALGPGPARIEPLRKMKLLAGLAVDPSPFFAELPEGAGYLRASEVAHRAAPPDGLSRQRMEDCIECGVCVSACPVTAPFSGPAALAAADRDRKERPEREPQALAFAALPRGVDTCERRFACSRSCPQAVDPGRRIADLRRSLASRDPRPRE